MTSSSQTSFWSPIPWLNTLFLFPQTQTMTKLSSHFIRNTEKIQVFPFTPLPYNLLITRDKLSIAINKISETHPLVQIISKRPCLKTSTPTPLHTPYYCLNPSSLKIPTPLLWKIVRILSISDLLLPASYRPFTLSNVHGKLFQSKSMISSPLSSTDSTDFTKGATLIKPY